MRARLLAVVGHALLVSFLLAGGMLLTAAWPQLERQAAAAPTFEDTNPAIVDGDVAQDSVPNSASQPPPVFRVGIQAGHWQSRELPDELARLRAQTGTSGGGVAEWALNLDIARRVAALLEDKGVAADVLPATIPPGYQADAFVALHADGDVSGRLSGFKLARATRSAMPEIDDALLTAIADEYGTATGLPVDSHISRNMTGYYAFSGRRLKHAIAPSTPAVILEMGFLTNHSDRQVLLGAPDVVAQGVAAGILRFLRHHEL